jgi:predicted nucleic acid-binding protein
VSEPLLDTNVFVHALTNDVYSRSCQNLLKAISAGTVRATLDPLVVHELTYVLPRYVKQMTRGDIAQYLTSVIAWEGVLADKNTLADALRLWSTHRVGFIDAYLSARAIAEDRQVYSRNIADFRICGAVVVLDWPTPT